MKHWIAFRESVMSLSVYSLDQTDHSTGLTSDIAQLGRNNENYLPSTSIREAKG